VTDPVQTAAALAARLGGSLVGPDTTYDTVGPIDTAGPSAVAYTSREDGHDSAAGILLCRQAIADRTCIIVEDPKLSFIQLLHEMFPVAHRPGIHPAASVDPSATIHPDAQIHAGVVVGPDCGVGANTVLFPGVVLYAGTTVGENCRIHAGTVLGSDGFSFHPTADGPVKVPQVGTVIVEDNVEMGANCCVDRAFLGTTRVGPGSKLDNLVHVGHNSELGRHVIIAAQTGLGGGVRIDDGAILGGQVGVVEHVHIGAQARVGAQSGVGKAVAPKSEVLGTPALAADRMRRIYAALRHLPELFRSSGKPSE
jgi:UDP-3-O-[3-hydroxymyristoyl] glucosamine N-acyltransferase